MALGVFLTAAPALAQSNTAQNDIVKRDSSLTVSMPTMPHEVSGIALKYINCFSADLAGKAMTPTPEAAMERAIGDCRSLRAESERQANVIEAPDWPKPNTSERATAVTKLFDGIDETQRYVARMMSQSAQPHPPTSQEPNSDAPNH